MAAPFNVLHIERLHFRVNVLLSLYIGLPVLLERVAEPPLWAKDIANVRNRRAAKSRFAHLLLILEKKVYSTATQSW